MANDLQQLIQSELEFYSRNSVPFLISDLHLIKKALKAHQRKKIQANLFLF
jgi:hypothetical protein